MELINPLVHQIPTDSGYVLALLIVALLAQKELRRAWHSHRGPVETAEALRMRRRRLAENGLIGLLLGLYGLVLLIRLLSFFP